ncbi:MAG: leucyl/phenylalanyl-tRNA--protein transferase [Flavobacteriaceae bacterium]|nr:leucyl/phenylalanyl-tRNA--protein transferase [Bacteroidia bacterium]MBT8287674.1 leucyl/phenylalanyl-tRNA--protein transferase [Bacteroidia bacterium]NNF73969.1 leucyl/phenylalanyl-tRNA--protein transferase [Flavobacteriaceae bacterium]NNK72477.1 leucyl/phenylalanyl-tRNA--protein transferase [Flavobacteriaceae bacterium]
MAFPEVTAATDEGLIAVGGNLSVKRLVEAYSKGIFPWFEKEEPILWWSPDPRFVLFPNKLKISKSMKALLNSGTFNVTYNQCFNLVVEHCAQIKRKGQRGSWITSSMIQAYNNLYEEGFARSVEVWQDEVLVGGLYGVDLGNRIFSGESMFSTVSNASKYGFISLVQQKKYDLIDCQVYTKHLESLGAEMLPRAKFLRYLRQHLSKT